MLSHQSMIHTDENYCITWTHINTIFTEEPIEEKPIFQNAEHYDFDAQSCSFPHGGKCCQVDFRQTVDFMYLLIFDFNQSEVQKYRFNC